MQIDRVMPEARGGSSQDENLCWCCDECNTYKGDAVEALGAIIVGQTPTGRATMRALRLNRPWLVHARQRWIEVGWHPPAEDA